MTRACKYCQRPVPEERGNSDYCSDSHKVLWNRKNKGGPTKKPIRKAVAGIPTTPKKPVRKRAEPDIYDAVAEHRVKVMGWKDPITPPEGDSHDKDAPRKIVSRTWTGPRVWNPLPHHKEGMAELMRKLANVKRYRQWAIATGLNHLAVDRPTVENWIKQAGHDPKLADMVFDAPLTESSDQPETDEEGMPV